MSDFVPFAGFAQRLGDTIRLSAAGGNGALEFSLADVSFATGQILVRVGAMAVNIEEPTQDDLQQRPSATSLRHRCPSSITSCIGSVQICCDDFSVIGPCRGAWGCARPRFIP